jgi:hypothetical protein
MTQLAHVRYLKAEKESLMLLINTTRQRGQPTEFLEEEYLEKCMQLVESRRQRKQFNEQ